jgi:hypothetical protein
VAPGTVFVPILGRKQKCGSARRNEYGPPPAGEDGPFSRNLEYQWFRKPGPWPA